MDTTFALPLTSSRIVCVCRTLAALPALLGAVDGIGTLLHIHASAAIGSVASTLSVLGILKIVPFVYARFARRATEAEPRGTISAFEGDGA